MKNEYFLILILILPVFLFSTTWYVDASSPPSGNGSVLYPFQTITEAINHLNDGDEIEVAAGTYTENLDFEEHCFKMKGDSPTTTIIDGDNNGLCIDLSEESSELSEIENFTIQNGSARGISIYLRVVNITNCIIKENSSADLGGGIYCTGDTSEDGYLTLDECIFKDNTTTKNGGGIFCGLYYVNMYNCTFCGNEADDPNSTNILYENGGAIAGSNWVGEMENVLFYDNSATNTGGAIYFYSLYGLVDDVSFNKCTIANNHTTNGLGGVTQYLTSTSNFDGENSIFWGNDGTDQIFDGNLVYFCCVENNYGPAWWNNIDDDPEFVDASNDDYSLEYYSPCIDTGDDSGTYDDPDGSRGDMGYLYHEQDVYSWQYGIFERQYLWKSFPKLQQDPNQGGDIGVENSLQSWNPLPDELELDIWLEDVSLTNGTYNEDEEEWTLTPEDDVSSVKGYKMEKDNATGCLMFSRGILCESDTELDTYAGCDTWLGYFLEDSQLVLDAFPSTVLDDAVLVKTMDWTISRNSTNDRWTGATGSSYINYADCVVIKTVNAHYDFTWETPSRSGEAHYRPVAEHFSFDDDIDYFPIYATFNENDMPDEVAVHIDGICCGAQVVEDTLCQICAYILEEDPCEEIDFAFWYDGRSGVKYINNYQVLNESKGKYESKNLVTGIPGIHARVYLEANDANMTPVNYGLNCYPNPFNPELTIYFNLRETLKVNLNVSNVKGQKVKNLANELFRPDDYFITWKGDDNAGNRVSSGVYYIRLQVGEDIVNRKVILVK